MLQLVVLCVVTQSVALLEAAAAAARPKTTTTTTSLLLLHWRLFERVPKKILSLSLWRGRRCGTGGVSILGCNHWIESGGRKRERISQASKGGKEGMKGKRLRIEGRND